MTNLNTITSYEDLQQFFLDQPRTYLKLLFRSHYSVTVPEIEMFTNSNLIENNYVYNELLCMDAGFSGRVYSKLNSRHFYVQEFPRSFFYTQTLEHKFSQPKVQKFLQSLKDQLLYVLCGDYYSINSSEAEEFWSSLLNFTEAERALWKLNQP